MMNICLTRLLRNSMRIESTLSVIVGMIIIYSQGSISVKKLYISLIECNFFVKAKAMLDTKNSNSYKKLCETFIAELAMIVCEAQSRHQE